VGHDEQPPRPSRAKPSYSAESAATRWREQHPDADAEAAGESIGGPSAEARDKPPEGGPRRSASAEAAALRREDTQGGDA
jgi:hypothetical protein